MFSGSTDDPAGKFGVASLTAAMLEEGAGSRSALDIADSADFLGADLGTSGGIDLLRGPCVTCTKFDKTIDMPIAEINGAKRNEPRNGR